MEKDRITKGEWKINRYSETTVEVENRSIASTGIYSDNRNFEQVAIENKANAQFIAFCGNLAQLHDPETWQSKLDEHARMKEALEHCRKVFESMAERGCYPLELMPYKKEFLGKQGFQFITESIAADAIK